MTALQRQLSAEPSSLPIERLSPQETALYTRDMLVSLRKIADRQGQGLLSHLLELAALEAKSLASGPIPTFAPPL